MPNAKLNKVDGPPKRRKKWWVLFWILNLVGLLLAFPLVKATWPLIQIMWKTRSSDAVAADGDFQKSSEGHLGEEFNQMAQSAAQGSDSEVLKKLSSKLDQLGELDQEQLNEWANRLFGEDTTKGASDEFDLDSATFSRIEKEVREVDGITYHIYLIELIDPQGHKAYRMAAYERPDPDFERSMLTLKLIEENPQLKKIYKAFSHVIGQSANPNNNPDKKGLE